MTNLIRIAIAGGRPRRQSGIEVNKAVIIYDEFAPVAAQHPPRTFCNSCSSIGQQHFFLDVGCTCQSFTLRPQISVQTDYYHCDKLGLGGFLTRDSPLCHDLEHLSEQSRDDELHRAVVGRGVEV